MSARSGAIFPDTEYDLSGRTLDLGHSGQMRTICFGRHDLNVSCPHLNERASTRGPREASRYVPPKLGRRLPNGTNKHDMFVKLTRKPSYGRHPIPYKLELMDEDLRPATCSRPGMAKHSATPRTLPPRKNLSLTERVPAVGLSPRPMGGVNAPENTQTVP